MHATSCQKVMLEALKLRTVCCAQETQSHSRSESKARASQGNEGTHHSAPLADHEERLSTWME